MASFTRYLSTTAVAPHEFHVRLSASLPIDISGTLRSWTCELKYSPIMPAFLVPKKGPPPTPGKLNSAGFFFSNKPYETLGTLRSSLDDNERKLVYFSEGLASIIVLNVSLSKLMVLHKVAGECPYEFWPMTNGKLDSNKVVQHIPHIKGHHPPKQLQLPVTNSLELAVYIEQIAASLRSLWVSYGIYFPSEQNTLLELAKLTSNLIYQHAIVSKIRTPNDDVLAPQKRKNSIVSALVEISGALSYAVTQGTSGGIPLLSNRSPFPHHSLLGVGGAVRALTRYTRYLEAAFSSRDATNVITGCYPKLKHIVPVRISTYKSGPDYRFYNGHSAAREHFDVSGRVPKEGYIPLVAHFSLRHGFMENKFFVTAASEALTAETLPHWTLMTLSHEIMHSRVRTIFQALFGWEVSSSETKVISVKQYRQFCAWLRAEHRPRKVSVLTGLRNAILNFCYVFDVSQFPQLEGSEPHTYGVTLQHVREAYSRHKRLAIELFVHFHDYFFVYAGQPKIYARSLWASWIKVAAPYERPSEYLMRSLATLACGTGYEPAAAFDYARDILLDALASLESRNIKSPLFVKLRELTSSKAASSARIDFDCCYYLIDTVRRYFASRTIATKIDSITSDPFAQGSAAADEYTANIYVFSEGKQISPIRYSLASLYKTLSREEMLDDAQWLTAWNYMVISS